MCVCARMCACGLFKVNLFINCRLGMFASCKDTIRCAMLLLTLACICGRQWICFWTLQTCADYYSVSVPPSVTTVTCKRLQSFSQKHRLQVTPKHIYTHDPTKLEWADSAVQAKCGNLSGKMSSQATCQETLGHSQLAEPLWTDPGLEKWIWCMQGDLHLIKYKQEMSHQTFPPNPCKRGRKKTPPPPLPLPKWAFALLAFVLTCWSWNRQVTTSWRMRLWAAWASSTHRAYQSRKEPSFIQAF